MSRNKQNQSKPGFGGKSASGVTDGVFSYSGILTLDQFSKRSGISAIETIKDYLMSGKMISLNDTLTDDQIAEICLKKNLDVKKEGIVAGEDDYTALPVFDKENDKETRAPVVTIMGHVDHGKTTLIDAIRHSRIAEGEAGGITQEIGAYQKSVNGKKITFLDTPGHEAFTAMRARGASITDIIILVVAADDGVKPQTVEAIDHAKAAKVPVIVAINKIDKPGADAERVKTQLSGFGVTWDGWGGDTMMFPISAKKNEGIDDLLDGVIMLAEMLQLKATSEKPAVGSVVEATLDKREGPKATLLVQNGTLHVGDYLAVGSFYCKVRRMANEYNKPLKEAGPSTPVQITGFSGVPTAGDRFQQFGSEQEAKAAADAKAKSSIGKEADEVSLAKIATDAANGVLPNINLVVKSDTQGTSEALRSSLAKISVPGTTLHILHCTSGDVTQGDVVLANASKAILIAFDVSVSPAIKELSKEQKVQVLSYNIIYKLLEDIEGALKGKLGPVMEEVIHGQMEVRSLFKASKVGQIAGCYVTTGFIKSSDKIRVFRKKDLVLKTHLSSLKRFKDDAKEVQTGFECGATIAENANLEVGDILEAYDMEEKKNG